MRLLSFQFKNQSSMDSKEIKTKGFDKVVGMFNLHIQGAVAAL